jgi:hypothetical protein
MHESYFIIQYRVENLSKSALPGLSYGRTESQSFNTLAFLSQEDVATLPAMIL